MKTRSNKPQPPHPFAYDGLDRVIHERARLGVLTSLVSHPKGLLFGDLKQLCGLTGGNLSRHLQVLEEAKLIEICKSSEHNRLQTLCRLTAHGRKRYLTYLALLEQVVLDATAAVNPDSDQASRDPVRTGSKTTRMSIIRGSTWLKHWGAMLRRRRTVWLVMLLASSYAYAGGGPFGIDHEWAYKNSGIWKRSYQLDLEYAVIATEGIGALWLGNDDPLGHEFWQSIDSTAVSGAAAQVLKYAFSRARPYQNKGPDKWFQGGCCQSFPSGEVTLQAAFVTPIIFDESARGNPWIWALELLPLYDGIGRLKQQAHWQSDVIAGWALGTAVGYWSAHRDTPLSVQILPRGVSIGLQKRF